MGLLLDTSTADIGRLRYFDSPSVALKGVEGTQHSLIQPIGRISIHKLPFHRVAMSSRCGIITLHAVTTRQVLPHFAPTWTNMGLATSRSSHVP